MARSRLGSLLLLVCVGTCESAKPSSSIIRTDSKRPQQTVAIDANGALSQGALKEASFAQVASLQDEVESLNADLHRASGNATANSTSRYSTSSHYCYEKDSSRLGDCWAQKPAADTSGCVPSSGSTVCKCPTGPNTDIECDIDELQSNDPTTGRCADKTTYVPEGQIHSNGVETDVTGSTEEMYCSSMVNNDQWTEKGLVAKSSDGPESKTKSSWWGCGSGYTSRSGRCYRKVRFIGESCWDSIWGGSCKGSDTSYDEYSTSCYSGKCVPYAFVKAREQCDCAWFGWNFLVVCSAAHGKCGGHACVLNTGDGKKYCDYATSQDWNSLR